MYSHLFRGGDPKANKISQRWESELTLDLPKDKWERIYDHIHKGPINISAQESGYKIYSRWYQTPDRIHTYHPSVSPLCWRCNSVLGSLLHIWWECPRIQPFWKEVHRIIAQITTYTPDFTPAQYLLHHTSIPYSAYKKSLPPHLINATKQCIPVHWRRTNPPKIAEWLHRVEKTDGGPNPSS